MVRSKWLLCEDSGETNVHYFIENDSLHKMWIMWDIEAIEDIEDIEAE